MADPEIIVLGSINMDLVVHGQRIPRPGETVVGGEFRQLAGGKGANQAVAAARLGQSPVMLLAALGDDPLARSLRDNLAAENICSEQVLEIPGSSSGVAAILVDAKGENCISVAPGANALIRPDHLEQLPSSAWQQATIFLASLEVPVETVARGLELARQHGLLTILNPAPASQLTDDQELLSELDVITPNALEAEQLSGLPVGSQQQAIEAGRQIQQRGPATVIITLGSQGAVLVGETEQLFAARAVQAIDSTAAGDCFNGALAVRLAEGDSIDAAVAFANKAASICVTRHGAGPSLPGRQDLATLE